MNKAKDLRYGMMAIVKKIALKTRNLLKEYLSGALITKKGNYVRRRYVN